MDYQVKSLSQSSSVCPINCGYRIFRTVPSFLAITLPLLVGFEKKISPLNAANFSTSDRMDEMNFRNHNIYTGLGSPFGLLDIWWVANFGVYISFGTIGLQENLFV